MVNLELYKIYVTVAKEQNITSKWKIKYISTRRNKTYKKFRKHTRNKTIWKK